MTHDVQCAFRMPTELVERLDAHAERMRGETPGVSISRADVVRLALGRGLDQLERELQPPVGSRRRRSG